MKNIEKIFKYIDNEQLSISEFERSVGLSNGYLSNTHKREVDITQKVLDKIKTTNEAVYNKIFAENYIQQRRNHKLSSVKDNDISVYQAGTRGSFIDLYEDENTAETIGRLNSSIFPGCDLALKVTGSSMYPMIVNQSIIVGEKLEDPKGISSGEIYAVHTKQGLKTCKYVHTLDNKPDFIRLVALSKAVPPQTILIEDVVLLMRVYFIINPS